MPEVATEERVVCNKCGLAKSRDDYTIERGRKNGLNSRCRDCDHLRQSTPEYREGKRRNKLQMRYGMTLEEYEALLDQQGGTCAIPECERTERLHVDHDHTTGRVRGILCFQHNATLGAVNDDVDQLRSLVSYLERSQ